MSNHYITIINAIIKEQESIVGPIAWIEADHVTGLHIKNHTLTIKGDGKKVVENLVKQYQTLFGRASVEVCKDAVKKIAGINKEELPDILL